MFKKVTTKELLTAIHSKSDIICFGAGRNIEKFISWLDDEELIKKIFCFVDNDKGKVGNKVTISGRYIEIISFEHLRESDLSQACIVIIPNAYEDIVVQLYQDDVLKKIDIYAFAYSLNIDKERELLDKKIPENLRLSNEPLIPKKIHYCWFGGGDIPEHNKKCMESWKKYCPDYEIIEWNENNYDVTKNLYIKQAYDNRKWGFIADYARLDIIYQYGGIYLDIDVELIKNIDELLYQNAFAGFEWPALVNLGSGVGARPGLEIIKELRDYYDIRELVKSDGTLDLTACPHLQTEVLIKHGLCQNGEYQIVDGLTIYPEKLLNGKCLLTRNVCLAPYTVGIHHYDGSWINEERKKIRLQFDKILEKEG